MGEPISVALFFGSLALYGFVGYWFWGRTAVVATTGEPTLIAPGDDEDTEQLDLPPLLAVLADLGKTRAEEDTGASSLRRRLDRAGFRQPWAGPVFHGAKLAVLVALPVVTFLLITLATGMPIAALPATIFGAYLGMVGPDRYLKNRARRRTELVGRSLPDFLDLLVISVESGLSLDQAVADTARDLRRAHPELSEELALFSNEVRAGASRADALRNLGTRTGNEEMRKLTSILIQADRFGTSVSKVLRNQARYMRIKRRQKAEESAHKVGVKLIFPIFFLIMPSVFLVTAGPAIIMLTENFSRMIAEM